MRVIFRGCLLVTLALLPCSVYADTEPEPHPYAQQSTDGKYIFVMLGPVETRAKEIPLVDTDNQIVRYLPPRYPASGLYLNDDSTTPLWTVDWYAFSVMVPSDGVHLIRYGPWAERLSDEAFTFFANGKMLRSYRISDLIDTSVGLEHSVSHFFWRDSVQLNESNHSLALLTFSHDRHEFDYTTGEIVVSRRPIRGVVAIAVVFTVFIILRRRH